MAFEFINGSNLNSMVVLENGNGTVADSKNKGWFVYFILQTTVCLLEVENHQSNMPVALSKANVKPMSQNTYINVTNVTQKYTTT